VIAAASLRHCQGDVTFVIFLSLSPPKEKGLPSQGLALINRQPLATITTKRREGIEGPASSFAICHHDCSLRLGADALRDCVVIYPRALAPHHSY
jgi:hypothetical protein